ncbi:MAG: hypothetical protein QOI95_3893, partial [Acidimicrobiaceae bacterium]
SLSGQQRQPGKHGSDLARSPTPNDHRTTISSGGSPPTSSSLPGTARPGKQTPRLRLLVVRARWAVQRVSLTARSETPAPAPHARPQRASMVVYAPRLDAPTWANASGRRSPNEYAERRTPPCRHGGCCARSRRTSVGRPTRQVRAVSRWSDNRPARFRCRSDVRRTASGQRETRFSASRTPTASILTLIPIW